MKPIRTDSRASRLTATVTLTALTLCAAPLTGAVKPAVAAATPAAIVNLDLTRYSKVARLEAGEYAGVSPGRIVMRVGQSVVFVNGDTRHHTATALSGAGEFPQNPRWTDAALRAAGALDGGDWSTGDLAPGARSTPIEAVKPGTYLYGCFYDYSAGMRGEIVVKP